MIMVNDIFEFFKSDRQVENRVLNKSRRSVLRSVFSKGINLSAFIAMAFIYVPAHAAQEEVTEVKKIERVAEKTIFTVDDKRWSNSPGGKLQFYFLESANVDERLELDKLPMAASVSGWLESFIKADIAGQRRVALHHLMDAVDSYETNGNWDEFSGLLDSVSIGVLSNTALVGLLRNSYVFREKIPSWSTFAMNVSCLISSREPNVKNIMSGLLT